MLLDTPAKFEQRRAEDVAFFSDASLRQDFELSAAAQQAGFCPQNPRRRLYTCRIQVVLGSQRWHWIGDRVITVARCYFTIWWPAGGPFPFKNVKKSLGAGGQYSTFGRSM
jgi:hypothetical protein